MIRITRRASYPFLLLSALLACKALDKKESTAASASGTPASPTATTAASGAEGDKVKTNFSGPKDAKGVDLAKLLGTKSDGWSLPAFAKLKENMTPADVGKLIAGAEKIDEYGFAEVKQSNVKGVALYKLSYQDEAGKKGLKFASIYFDPTLTDEPFWVALASHLKEKLGDDFTDHGGHHLNWISSAMNIWSLSKGIGHDGYELQIAVPE